MFYMDWESKLSFSCLVMNILVKRTIKGLSMVIVITTDYKNTHIMVITGYCQRVLGIIRV